MMGVGVNDNKLEGSKVIPLCEAQTVRAKRLPGQKQGRMVFRSEEVFGDVFQDADPKVKKNWVTQVPRNERSSGGMT